MADGDLMLDANGDEILDDDGDEQLSDGAGDACCCCPPDGKKCFQEWIASWDCVALTWSGPVTDNRLCLPVDTSTEWTKISGDASGCQYRKYVPYDPIQCCSVNGDCTSALGDTATPDLPFGGAEPADCDCPTAVACGNCTTTPLTIPVSFDSVENGAVCNEFCSYGSMAGDTGTLGDYTVTQTADPCIFEFVGTGPSVKHFYEQLDCTGPFNVYDGLKVRLTIGAGSATLEAMLTGLPFIGEGNPVTGEDFGTLHWFKKTITIANCCDVMNFTDNERTYDCDNVGQGGSAVATPPC